MLSEKEREWVEQLKTGQVSAMNLIIEAHGDKMTRTAFLMTGDRGLSEDCVQEMFMSFYFNIRHFRSEASLATYLYRILINTCKQKLRKPWFKRVAPTDEMEERGESGMEEASVQRISIQGALSKLGSKYREVLILHYFNQLTIEEISQVLNENGNTIKTRLKRGREQLKPYLEEEGFGDGLPQND